MTANDLVEAYAEWLGRFEWSWFATLTFRGSPSRAKAERLFRTWIGEIDKQVGTPKFRWVRVEERGAFADHLHYHVLVGGMREPWFHPWRDRWLELGRDIDLREFQPDENGIFYILKKVRPNADFDIDMHLQPTDSHL